MSVLKKVMYFAYLVYAKSSEVNGDIMPVLRPVGGERDDNNCLTGAGFSWCETSQSCIRRWVTPCEDNYSDCNDCLRRQRKGENIAGRKEEKGKEDQKEGKAWVLDKEIHHDSFC